MDTSSFFLARLKTALMIKTAKIASTTLCGPPTMCSPPIRGRGGGRGGWLWRVHRGCVGWFVAAGARWRGGGASKVAGGDHGVYRAAVHSLHEALRPRGRRHEREEQEMRTVG
jgi:hypothetical protein